MADPSLDAIIIGTWCPGPKTNAYMHVPTPNACTSPRLHLFKLKPLPLSLHMPLK